MAPPINDNLADAILIGVGYNTIQGTTIDATEDTGEAAALGYNPGPDVWYQIENQVPTNASGINLNSINITSTTPGYEPYWEVYSSIVPNPDYSDLTYVESGGNGTEGPIYSLFNLPGNSSHYYWLLVASWNGSDEGNFEIDLGIAWGGLATDFINGASGTASVSSGAVRDTQVTANQWDGADPWPNSGQKHYHDDMTDTLIFTAPTDGRWHVETRVRAQGTPTGDYMHFGLCRNGVPLYTARVWVPGTTGTYTDISLTSDDITDTYLSDGQSYNYEPDIRVRAGDEISLRLFQQNPGTRYAEIHSVIFSTTPQDAPPYRDSVAAPASPIDTWQMSELPIGSATQFYNLGTDDEGAGGVTDELLGYDFCVMPNGDIYVAFGEGRTLSADPDTIVYTLRKWNGTTWSTITQDFAEINAIARSTGTASGFFGATGTSSTIAVVLPHEIDDITIISAFARSSATIATPSGYTLKTSWTRGTTTYYIFWKRETTKTLIDENITISLASGSGDKYAKAWSFCNVIKTGDPFHAFQTTSGTADPDTVSGLTTTIENAFIAMIGMCEDDNAGSAATVISSGGDPELDSRNMHTGSLDALYFNSTGADAGMWAQAFHKFYSGSTGDYTVTFSGAPPGPGWGAFLCALIPDPDAIDDGFPWRSGVVGNYFYPNYVSVDTDGTDVYIGYSMQYPRTPHLNGGAQNARFAWRVMKYSPGTDTFTELGTESRNGFAFYDGGVDDTTAAEESLSFKLRIGPDGKIWVGWAEVVVPFGANYNSRPFLWYWNGSAWIDTNAPFPPTIRNARWLINNYGARSIHLDFTFCHHDGSSNWPSLAYSVFWPTIGAADNGREIIYAEYNGSSWTTVQTRADQIWTSGLLRNADDWGHEWWQVSLINDGSNPILIASLHHALGDDHLAATKIIDSSGIAFESLGFPGLATLDGMPDWRLSYSGLAAIDNSGNIYVSSMNFLWERLGIVVNREAGDDKGWMVASATNAYIDGWAATFYPSFVKVANGKIYMIHSMNQGTFGVWEMEYIPGGGPVSFYAFAPLGG